MPAAAMARMRSPSHSLSVAVEPGGGLVEQQDRGAGDAGPGDRHELALALAQLAGRAVAERGDPDVLERPGDRGLAGRPGDRRGRPR